jgi:hypothetical protein
MGGDKVAKPGMGGQKAYVAPKVTTKTSIS